MSAPQRSTVTRKGPARGIGTVPMGRSAVAVAVAAAAVVVVVVRAEGAATGAATAAHVNSLKLQPGIEASCYNLEHSSLSL